jgi:hypothetical protein
VREWRVKELDLLRLTIFRDNEIFRLQIRDVFAFFVLDDDVDVDEVRLNANNFILLPPGNDRSQQYKKNNPGNAV